MAALDGHFPKSGSPFDTRRRLLGILRVDNSLSDMRTWRSWSDLSAREPPIQSSPLMAISTVKCARNGFVENRRDIGSPKAERVVVYSNYTSPK
jgi:hypothetical protein